MFEEISSTEEFLRLQSKINIAIADAYSRFLAKTRLIPETLVVSEMDYYLIHLFQKTVGGFLGNIKVMIGIGKDTFMASSKGNGVIQKVEI